MKKLINESENLSSEVSDKDLNNSVTDEFGVRYSKDGKKLLNANVLNCSSYAIKEGTLTICDVAFRFCSSLQSVIIPDSVRTIGNGAFCFCSSLQNVTIPDSVTSIGNGAFGYCSSLQSVTIPDSVTSIGNATFYFCSSLQNVTIPDSVTSIGDYAFDGCSSLQNRTISESMMEKIINEYEIWPVVTDEDLNNSVTDEFGVKYSKDGKRLLNAGNLNCSSYPIKEGTRIICYKAFSFCSSLQSVTFPDSVTTIGDYAFEYCSSLQIFIIPKSIEHIGINPFYGCNIKTFKCLSNFYEYDGYSLYSKHKEI